MGVLRPRPECPIVLTERPVGFFRKEYEVKGKGRAGANFGAEIEHKAHRAAVRGLWKAVCIGADGREKWAEEYENIVMDAALDDVLDSYLANGTQTTSWFVGLKNTGTVSGTQTLGTHAAWAFVKPYSNATDPAWTPGAVSSGSVDNSVSTADFTCTVTADVSGSFLKSINTVSGTAGFMYAAGDFTSVRSVVNGDTLKVTATFTMIDDA